MRMVVRAPLNTYAVKLRVSVCPYILRVVVCTLHVHTCNYVVGICRYIHVFVFMLCLCFRFPLAILLSCTHDFLIRMIGQAELVFLVDLMTVCLLYILHVCIF